MKIKLFVIVAIIALGLASCKSDSKTVDAKKEGNVAERSAGSADYSVDTQASVLKWTGGKAFSDNAHSGTIDITKGVLSVQGGNITSGDFTVNMGSIVTTDEMPADKKGQLVGHLSSPDFFNVPAHPNATFEITAVEAVTGDAAITHKVSGNLTLSGVTKEITIPAKVTMMDGAVMATSSFSIDRSDFGVKYGSSKFDVNLVKDKVINDDIDFNLNLVAKAAM